MALTKATYYVYFSVTLQSFIWAGRGKERKDEVLKVSNREMANLDKSSKVTLGQVLAARCVLKILVFITS